MQRILIIFSIFFTLFASSCAPEEEPVPEYVLPQEKMIEVFKDILILESQVERLKFGRDTAQQVYEVLEKDIWKKHQITEERFKKSHKYYLNKQDNLEGFESLYKALVDSFTVMEKQLETGKANKKNNTSKDKDNKKDSKPKTKLEKKLEEKKKIKPF